ncbi:MAG: hypothetical protein HN564_00720 [Flavobacteriales bacterium]|jgi:hypothetical protein|nr:hypothetical protein [Flavobacteriales bacterium]
MPLFLVTVVLLSSCIPPSYIDNQKRDRYRITEEEIKSVPQADTAWDVLEYLRPNLLTRDRRRHVGFTGGMDALVFINGARAGYKDRLRTIPAMDIIEIKYLDSIEAGGKYGFTSGGGVFLVIVE